MSWLEKIFGQEKKEVVVKRVEFNFDDYSFKSRVISIERTNAFQGQFRVVVEITVIDNRGNIVKKFEEEHFVQETAQD